MGGYAWVTLATNDSYSLGALVLANSLKQVGTTHQLAVLVTPGVTSAMRQKLSTTFNVVQEVNILDSKDETNLRLLKRPELGVTFTKLHCWRLTQFDKCVFLDADTLVLRNCDELLDREELSAAPDVGWPDCFNSGVFVYRPSNETYEKLVQFALEKGSFDGGDQGLLNLYFSDWATKDISKHLPFIYNLCSTACYSYLPAFKQFGMDAKIIHFIGSSKPWLQYFNTETRKVQPSSDVKHLEGILQHWWSIFCSLIHPQLTTDMSGLAGAFAQLTLGAPRTVEQSALDNHLRRQGWEVGNIDYMGRDSFNNIWSKICETLSAGIPSAPQTTEATSSSTVGESEKGGSKEVQPSPQTVLPQDSTAAPASQSILLESAQTDSAHKYRPGALTQTPVATEKDSMVAQAETGDLECPLIVETPRVVQLVTNTTEPLSYPVFKTDVEIAVCPRPPQQDAIMATPLKKKQEGIPPFTEISKASAEISLPSQQSSEAPSTPITSSETSTTPELSSEAAATSQASVETSSTFEPFTEVSTAPKPSGVACTQECIEAVVTSKQPEVLSSQPSAEELSGAIPSQAFITGLAASPSEVQPCTETLPQAVEAPVTPKILDVRSSTETPISPPSVEVPLKPLQDVPNSSTELPCTQPVIESPSPKLQSEIPKPTTEDSPSQLSTETISSQLSAKVSLEVSTEASPIMKAPTDASSVSQSSIETPESSSVAFPASVEVLTPQIPTPSKVKSPLTSETDESKLETQHRKAAAKTKAESTSAASASPTPPPRKAAGGGKKKSKK